MLSKSELLESSLYHTSLFRYHVLEDLSLANPGIPPFYNKEFFGVIRRVHLQSSLNIFKMSEKDWYTLLVEDSCTMEMSETGEDEYIKCRVERASPDTDWENCLRLARLPGLGPEKISFLFKLLHQILPTQERVARTKPNANPHCKIQGCHSQADENLPHAMIHCQANDQLGMRLQYCLREIQSGLRLNIGTL